MVENLNILENATVHRKNPWWFKFPTLVVNNHLHITPSPKTNLAEAEQVYAQAQPVFRQIMEEFERAQCKISKTMITTSHDQSFGSTEELNETSSHVVALNPVFLGALPRQVESAMESYTIQPNDQNLTIMSRTFRKYLPEEMPLLSRIGKKIFRRLGRLGIQGKIRTRTELRQYNFYSNRISAINDGAFAPTS